MQNARLPSISLLTDFEIGKNMIVPFPPPSFAVPGKINSLHPALAPTLDLWPCFLLL